jgi:hypothetical protein
MTDENTSYRDFVIDCILDKLTTKQTLASIDFPVRDAVGTVVDYLISNGALNLDFAQNEALETATREGPKSWFLDSNKDKAQRSFFDGKFSVGMSNEIPEIVNMLINFSLSIAVEFLNHYSSQNILLYIGGLLPAGYALFEKVLKIKELKSFERCVFSRAAAIAKNDKGIAFDEEDIKRIFNSRICLNAYKFPCDCFNEDTKNCEISQEGIAQALQSLMKKGAIKFVPTEKPKYYIT